jgi:hypothetical protein
MMKLLLIVASAISALGASSGAATAKAEKPNLLFILADQWRAQAFGYAEDPNVQTARCSRMALKPEQSWRPAAVSALSTPLARQAGWGAAFKPKAITPFSALWKVALYWERCRPAG